MKPIPPPTPHRPAPPLANPPSPGAARAGVTTIRPSTQTVLRPNVRPSRFEFSPHPRLVLRNDRQRRVNTVRAHVNVTRPLNRSHRRHVPPTKTAPRGPRHRQDNLFRSVQTRRANVHIVRPPDHRPNDRRRLAAETARRLTRFHCAHRSRSSVENGP